MSARLNQNPKQQSVEGEILITLMNRVHIETCIKKRIKNAVDVINYVVTNFNKIKRSYINRKDGSFVEFSKTVSYKIPEMIETSEKYLQKGYNVNGSIKKLRYYQDIYEKIYTDYNDNMILENRCQTLTLFIAKKKERSDYYCQEMKKHIKKFLVNQLPLCRDVIEIIKSYCFYDKKTSETIKMVKSIKNHIVTLFDIAEQSRKNGLGQYEHEDPDEIEHWSFCFNEDEVGFQGVNCQFCGNYLGQYLQDWASPNIICNCNY